MKDAAAFFAKVSHKRIQVEDVEAEVAIPEGIQLEEFIRQSLEKGYSIQCSDDDEEEVKWAD